MVARIENFIETTSSARSAIELKRCLTDALADEGYENMVFARAENRRLKSIPWSVFPDGYLDTYRTRQWDLIDPVVQHIQHARGPFHWSGTAFPAKLSSEQRIFFEECRELKVHSGITIPLRGPRNEIDLISVSLRERHAVDGGRLSHIYMLSAQYWLKFCELEDRRDLGTATLTNKELECLRWCKEGKTNWEIGEIVFISEKTVEFHLGNAMRKLGALNRITAVMIAIRRGLIAL